MKFKKTDGRANRITLPSDNEERDEFLRAPHQYLLDNIKVAAPLHDLMSEHAAKFGWTDADVVSVLFMNVALEVESRQAPQSMSDLLHTLNSAHKVVVDHMAEQSGLTPEQIEERLRASIESVLAENEQKH